jgi:hypothetical protein
MSAKKQTTTTAKSLPGGDSATYVTRPKGKPSVTTKGKLNEWDNGYKEFIPQGQKPSNRTMLKQLGNSSFYRNEGEKESSWSLHLNVGAKDCADPVGEMFDQFMLLTEAERKTAPKLPPDSEGRMLMDNGQGLQIWLDRGHGRVTILAELRCDTDIERQLLQAESQMNVCIARNRQEIINHISNK